MQFFQIINKNCYTFSLYKEEPDFHPALLFLRVLVFPLVEPEAAFDVERAALGHVLGDRLALFTPGLDIHENHFLAALARLHLELPVDRQRKLANRRALGRHAQLGVAREIAHQEDFVERGHGGDGASANQADWMNVR